MSKTLIVPGLDGSPAPHWQDWWAATEPTAEMVALSHPSHPVPAVWEYELGEAVLRNPDSILVGHSLGAIVIVRLLARYPHLPVRAALLVAPAETRGSDRIGHFGPIPERLLPVPSTVVASRNDPCMTLPRARQLASSWGAQLVDLGEVGHINVASGFGPWPKGRAFRDALILRSARAPFAWAAQSAWRAV